MKNKVISNGIYLYILQIFNTIIPLLTLPYITRVLGVEQYGVFSKVLNYITYFHTFVEYGFTLTGARKISLAKDNNEVNNTFSNIICCKLINAILSVVLLSLLSLLFFTSNIQRQCMFILMLILISEVFLQTWMLQGFQYMQSTMIVCVCSRTISTILIFIFINSSDDLLLYAFLYVITNVLTALLSIIIVVRKFNVRFIKPNLSSMIKETKDGWSLFTTSFASKICSNIGITVLGLFFTDVVVGGYTAIQKIPYIIVMMFAPIGQAIYPYICKLYSSDLKKGISLIKKIFTGVFAICVIGISVLISFRKLFVNIVYGVDYLQYANLIIPLAIWLLFSILNNIFGIQILVARGYQKEYSNCFLVSLIFLIVLNFAFGWLLGALGVAIATAIGEIMLSLFCIITIYRKRVLYVD